MNIASKLLNRYKKEADRLRDAVELEKVRREEIIRQMMLDIEESNRRLEKEKKAMKRVYQLALLIMLIIFYIAIPMNTKPLFQVMLMIMIICMYVLIIKI